MIRQNEIEELEHINRANKLLSECKTIEKNTKMHFKKISHTTYVACKNKDRIALYEKAHKGVKIVYTNETAL